jgi:hypothetical protein
MRESAGAEQNINMYSKLDRRVDKSYDSRCYSFFCMEKYEKFLQKSIL